jgi:hypothetical protein
MRAPFAAEKSLSLSRLLFISLFLAADGLISAARMAFRIEMRAQKGFTVKIETNSYV